MYAWIGWSWLSQSPALVAGFDIIKFSHVAFISDGVFGAWFWQKWLGCAWHSYHMTHAHQPFGMTIFYRISKWQAPKISRNYPKVFVVLECAFVWVGHFHIFSRDHSVTSASLRALFGKTSAITLNIALGNSASDSQGMQSFSEAQKHFTYVSRSSLTSLERETYEMFFAHQYVVLESILFFIPAHHCVVG